MNRWFHILLMKVENISSYQTRPAAVAGANTDSVSGLSAESSGLRQLCDRLSLAWSRAIAQLWWSKFQHAALPFRKRDDGNLEIMLVTSRGTGRWIIPKGWPKKGRPPYVTAAREAMEEGGILGNIYDKPIGTFRYEKQHLRFALPCEVTVFALEVAEQMPEWPERRERQTRWFDVCDAATAVQETELAALMLVLAAKISDLTAPIETSQFLPRRKQKPRRFRRG
jgi:8-oxo-dGTP pyrophosphatase MutT (NUDIX family)